MARFHTYSWTNAMLIHNQRPDATRVAGYHTWRDLGRAVRRGEKGIVIYAPLTTKRQTEDRTLALREPDTGKRVVGFRAVYVFDVSQTEGKALPAPARASGDPQAFGETLKTLVAARGIELTYNAGIAPADGVSFGGRIQLRPGLSPAEEFAVLAHELAHEMMHRGSDRRELPKVVRETQAEAVAYVVCCGVGLQTNRAAADYITLYNGDAKTLADSLATIQKTSAEILDELLPRDRGAPDQEPTIEVAPEPDAGTREHATPTRPGPDASDTLSMDR